MDCSLQLKLMYVIRNVLLLALLNLMEYLSLGLVFIRRNFINRTNKVKEKELVFIVFN